MRVVFLDSGPLGLLAQQAGKPRADRCRRWLADLLAAGARVFVPEIADFEVRRKLLHIGATAGIRRLDQIKATLDYAPITTAGMLRAAELWADLRRAGLPTAAPGSLDGGLHPGRSGVVVCRAGRRDHGGHGQRRAPRPDGRRADVGNGVRMTALQPRGASSRGASLEPCRRGGSAINRSGYRRAAVVPHPVDCSSLPQ
jgi:hypothetical protein